MGASPQAFCSWKRRYAGLGVSELQELLQLREENRKLKTLEAYLSLDKHILEKVLSKKSEPAARRKLVSSICQQYQLSEKRACGLVGITRWINRYRSRRGPQDELLGSIAKTENDHRRSGGRLLRGHTEQLVDELRLTSRVAVG
jgi:hypothetical protein